MTKSVKRILIGIAAFMVALSFGLGFNQILKSAYADDSLITMTTGAWVNVESEDSSGLKFEAKANRTKVDEIKTQYPDATVQFGMVIVPTDMLNDALSDKSKSFTIDGLSDYSALSGYAYYDVAKNVKTTETEYVIYMTVTGIIEANYSRKFSARAFIKLTSESGFSDDGNGFEKGADGSLYCYSDYLEENNSRSVYEVAANAYSDRKTTQDAGYTNMVDENNYSPLTDEQRSIVKTYVDGVAVIGKSEEAVSVSNNTDYYTSPYTVTAGKDGKTYVVTKTEGTTHKSPVSVIYNGTRYASLPITDGDVTIGTIKQNGATVDSDGSLTMMNKSVSNNSMAAGQYAEYNNYYSFVGDYGVGYYLDFEFTGYNMPQLIFFAKITDGDENGYSSPTTYKAGKYSSTDVNRQGVLVLNGFADADGYFQVFGPKRMYGTTQKYGEQGNQTRMFLSYENYPELTRKGQVENKDKKYSMTIGTHIGRDGKVWMEVILSSNGAEIYHVNQSLGLTEAEVGVGDIIIMPPFGDYTDSNGDYIINGTKTRKIDGVDVNFDVTSSTFKTSVPYYQSSANIAVKSNGATLNADGSLNIVTKCGYLETTTANVAAMWSQYWNYYAFTGNYGVGYYLDFTFTGYQMPQLIFFASTGSTDDKAYASISTYGTGANSQNSTNVYSRKGVVILNGLTSHGDYLQAFGPYRMFRTGTSSNPIYDEYGKEGSGLFRIGKDDENGAYKELTRAGQKENTDKKYALTVGTFIGEDGKVWLEMLLKDATTGAEVCHLQKSLGLTETEVGTGDIIILPPLGTDGEYLVDGTTSMTITCSDPYKKTNSSNSNF